MHELTTQEIDMVAGGSATPANVLGSLGILIEEPAIVAWNTTAGSIVALAAGASPIAALQAGIALGQATATAVLNAVPLGSAGLASLNSAFKNVITNSINNVLHGVPPITIGV
jgi:hypothetical protein